MRLERDDGIKSQKGGLGMKEGRWLPGPNLGRSSTRYRKPSLLSSKSMTSVHCWLKALLSPFLPLTKRNRRNSISLNWNEPGAQEVGLSVPSPRRKPMLPYCQQLPARGGAVKK